MKFKVDNEAWVPTSISSFVSFGSLSINAFNSVNNTSMGISIPQDAEVGEYDLDWAADYLRQYNFGNSVFMSSTSGKLNITKHDKTSKRINGTFNYVAEEINGGQSATITEGEFEISY